MDSRIKRLTYLDADIFFFKSHKILLDELEASGKEILITEHAYNYKDDRTERNGRFCLQFLTISKTMDALANLHLWQDQCRECCYSYDFTGETFGDQKYLNEWPDLYDKTVHILEKQEEALGPWNIEFFLNWMGRDHYLVLYHFHSFRILNMNFLLLVVGFDVRQGLETLYRSYIGKLKEQMLRLEAHYIQVPLIPYLREYYLKTIKFGGIVYEHRDFSFIYR